MEIACLGWGSLVWNSGDLPVHCGWFDDGPFLPIEFARESSGKRITLVLVPGVRPVQSLWALMSVDDVVAAREALCSREGIPPENLDKDMGFWTPSANSGGTGVSEVDAWARQRGLDAVVWTDLPPGFRTARGEVPTPDDIVDYLGERDEEVDCNAEESVRRAPVQVETEIRSRLESELGWTPVPADYAE